jgi:hypothetical protein
MSKGLRPQTRLTRPRIETSWTKASSSVPSIRYGCLAKPRVLRVDPRRLAWRLLRLAMSRDC